MPNLWLFDGEIQNYVLCELKLLFNASATSFFKHTLPMPNSRLMTKIQNKMLREELNYDLKNQYSISFPKLNNDQKQYYYVIDIVLSKKSIISALKD